MKSMLFNKKYTKYFILVATIVVILLSWTLINSFSETTDSSAWDGVVAKSFASGTGTNENPYVISNSSELAYFKQVLEGENAISYLDKVYSIASSMNYGEHEFIINNKNPFTGTIDGNGNAIYNMKIINGIFNELEDATIKNINLYDFTYSQTNETGALFANNVVNSNIEMLIMAGETSVDNELSFGGFVYTSHNSTYSNVVLNYNITTESDNITRFAYTLEDDIVNNILINKDKYDYTKNNTSMVFNEFEFVGNSIELLDIENINAFSNDDYRVNISDNKFVIDVVEASEKTNPSKNESHNSKAPIRGVVASDTIVEHASGIDGNTLYINDFISDYNYMKGLNYTEVRGRTLPSETSTGYYNNENLVKVEIIYDGADINNSSLVGAVSPINNENTNKFVYFKYYALERNSNGSLATNSDGDYYIRIELIDNPFTKRPYVNNVEYAFNGWVCNQSVDTTLGLCANATFSFKKETYTRYLDIPVDGGSELVVHLNATWYVADVKTSASNISNFNSMSMQDTTYTTYITETVTGYARWNATYYTMQANGTTNNGSSMSSGTYYKTDQNSHTYTYNRNRTRCNAGNGRVCYMYRPVNTVITNNSQYTGGTVEFFPDYTQNTTQTATVINGYDPDYMNFVPDPNGTFTGQVQTPQIHSFLTNGINVSGFFYKVSNPTSTMINTKEYYDSDGSLCTSASSCTTAYKLIQYDDSTNNSNGHSIYITETLNGDIVDADKYYYLVTRDTNIFRYTSTTSLAVTNLQVNKPFTVTGISETGNSITGVLSISSNLSLSNDLVIENIKFTGASNDNVGEFNNLSNTPTNSISANDHNLKIGRNISNSSSSTTVVARMIYGHTANTTGNFKIIVESGYYTAFSGTTSTSATFNEQVISGSDFDRVRNDDSKLIYKIGYVSATASGNYVAGSESPFVVFGTIKSGYYGFGYSNNNLTATADLESGIYVNGKRKYFTDPVGVKVEGGIINVIYGGSGFTGTETNNGVYISMSGGTVKQIYGGSTQTGVGGNRIINISGGTVTGSVLAGSNCASCTSGGEIKASTIVYVGGTAVVGSSTPPAAVGGVDSGSVFGAGGGGSNGNSASVYNSHVVINGGTIYGSVYGGGNNGGIGINNNTASHTLVEVLSGTVMNGVYGGSNAASFSQSNHAGSSYINVNVYGGNVSNVYGGSNTSGTINGSVAVNVYGGTINQNVYGGGRGSATVASSDVDVTIGNANISTTPQISGNVYGGSAFGTVNSASAGDVTVTVNKGVVLGSVFGGGQGDANNTPSVLGDINVTINGGDVTSVFGGNDQAGSHSEFNEVHLNGGIVGSVYGGGNRSSVTTTHVYLNGSTVTTIYGGSNTLGDVTTSNVTLTTGTVGSVYGGNNEGGTCGVTNVLVNGTATVNSSVYGGGNQVNTTTTNVTITAANGTIPNVYGGGNSASVTTVNVTKNGANVGNLFGGSNSSGTVATSIINHSSGATTTIYGGNNAGGNTVSSTINLTGGSATNIYGGGNQANSGTSNVNISGGTSSSVFGGGNQAGLTTSNIHVTSGNVTTIYGGSNNSGLVTTSNVLIDNTSSPITAIYGGGNLAQVGSANVVFNGGSATNIYGGGNLAQVNNNTLVDINGGTINQNIYGGGNYGVVKGNSTVTITNATILGSAYAGGNGSSATLEGNTNITIDGNTVIGTPSSIHPASGSVFGGGNQAYTGVQANNDSTSTVNIMSGTIYGNVYGGANTSVIYGSTIVNIGKDTISNSSSLVPGNLYIKGHIFGGGEANASGSEIYDWFFISVTEGVHINVNANTYNNFRIDGSFYGGGNASSAEGDSYLLINNYGTVANPKRNISVQRVTYVVLNNSSMVLEGAIDRANDYDREKFSISRVVNLKLKNNSTLYLETGANLLEEFESLDSNNNIARVTINENTNTVSKTVDNRIYMYEGKNLNIAKDQQVTDYGSVSGMTFLGIFNYNNDDNINTGIYNQSYAPGDILPWSGTFSRGSYVLGKHETNHDITVNGFYSHFINEDTTINEVKYIEPTPTDALFYMWFIGENVLEYNVNLVASKYSTLGSVETSFLEFSKPNTSFQILSFDGTEIASGVSLIDKNDIARIADNPNDANNKFGLSMEASNTGWLTNGRTSFYTSEPSISGTTYYEGENSTLVPTMLFYLYHSKNITEEKDLGTVRISIMAITKLNALSNEIKRLVVNVNMSSALFQTTEYEGAMTPGDKYELFTSTSTNITTKSKFSAYYSLYDGTSNIYRTGYHRVLASSYVFPENTKITMLNFVDGVPEYYYHIITSSDVLAAQTEYQIEGECSYNLSMFTKMGSRSNNSNYDDAAMNAIYYDGTSSSEEFIFIVDFSDAQINSNHLGNTLLIEMRDNQDESIMTVLGIQHSQLTYNLYSNCDSQIDITATESLDPLYIGYSDIFDVAVDYQNSAVGGIIVTDTQYFDSKLGLQISILNSENHLVSGTDLTGTYFMMDGVPYYPDISGVTHIKLSDKVGNTEKWITFTTDNASLATGDYTFVFEAFGSPDGVYYSSGDVDTYENEITIINSTYGLRPEINQNSVVFNSQNDKNLTFTVNYTSMLSNPNVRLAMYRRKYDEIYDTNYELVDLQDYVSQSLFATSNTNEYLIINHPDASNTVTLLMDDELLTGTYRLSFRLYDGDTMIGDVIRYIIVK